MEAKTMYTWRTKKQGSRYTALVYKMTERSTPNKAGHCVETETVKTIAGFSTRSRAKGRAVQWVRYFRAA